MNCATEMNPPRRIPKVPMTMATDPIRLDVPLLRLVELDDASSPAEEAVMIVVVVVA